jgi:hypothetical protein
VSAHRKNLTPEANFDCRAGPTIQEVACVLSISKAAVARESTTARLWLLRHISEGSPA